MARRPIIVKTPGTLSGRPRIDGHRIGVSDIWLAYLRALDKLAIPLRQSLCYAFDRLGLVPTAQWNGVAMKNVPSDSVWATASCHSFTSSGLRTARM